MIRVILVGLVLLAACKRGDALYCDETTPCTDPDRSYCDLLGEYPAANGVGRTCIADPNEPGQPDAGIMLPDATVVCSESSECSSERPICRSNLCELCETGPECVARDPESPHCSGEGACLQCLENADCAVATRPFCASTGVCNPCSEHSECDSGVCEVGSGECVASVAIIYADSGVGTDNPSCGDAPGVAACRTLNGALFRVPSGRNIILMAPGYYMENATIGLVDLRIIGYGAHLRRQSTLSGETLFVNGTAEVSIEGLSIEAGKGFSGGHGIACVTATISLLDVTLTQNEDVGLYGDLCAVDMVRTKVHTNAQQGIWLQNASKLAMQQSVIRANGFHGLSAHNSEIRIYRSRIMENETGGVFLAGGSFELENNFIVQNGNLLESPGEVTGGIVIAQGLSVVGGPHALRHNTVAGNLAPMLLESAGIVCGLAPGMIESDGNIVVDNDRAGSGADLQSAGPCGFSYSNVTGIAPENGNISVAPTFVNADTGDYHLATGSAGIDAANPNSPTSDDIDGDTRPNGGGYDMGADER